MKNNKKSKENKTLKTEKITKDVKRKPLKAYRKKQPTKSLCKNYDVGNCEKFHCRCFDCKEYKKNSSYLDN